MAEMFENGNDVCVSVRLTTMCVWWESVMQETTKTDRRTVEMGTKAENEDGNINNKRSW